MTSRVLSPTDLHAYIPHRGPNLLLDQLVIRADGKEGIGEVLVLPGDARGRELFGRLGPGGVPCWSEPFLGEILALCGIVLVRDELTAMGKEGVFSMVSRIAIGRLLRLDRPVRARAELMRSRSGFWQFGGGIEQDGEVIFSGEFMAGAGSIAGIGCQAAQTAPTPTPVTALPAGLLDWKAPHLRFIDGCAAFDPVARTAAFTYRYPVDHPFVPGHFPNAALMMGMTQWQAVADGAWALHRLLGHDGEITVNGRLRRHCGAEIVDVRELTLSVENGLPRISATKRLAFREPVRPGDDLIVEVAAV